MNQERYELQSAVLELNKSHLPIVKINKQLDKYKDMILFRKKVDEANNMLRTVGLPKRNN